MSWRWTGIYLVLAVPIVMLDGLVLEPRLGADHWLRTALLIVLAAWAGRYAEAAVRQERRR